MDYIIWTIYYNSPHCQHGGDSETCQGETVCKQRIWSHSETQRGLEREKETVASWGTRSVGKQTLNVNRERDCSKKGWGHPLWTRCTVSIHSSLFNNNPEPRPKPKFYLWWAQETWNYEHTRMESWSRETVPLGCHLRGSTKDTRWDEETLGGVEAQSLLLNNTMETGCKTLSASTFLDQVSFLEADEARRSKEPHRHVVVCKKQSFHMMRGERLGTVNRFAGLHWLDRSESSVELSQHKTLEWREIPPWTPIFSLYKPPTNYKQLVWGKMFT